MQTRGEALHFLKDSQVLTGKKRFVRSTHVPTDGLKWKIFTSEDDYRIYVKFKKHKR